MIDIQRYIIIFIVPYYFARICNPLNIFLYWAPLFVVPIFCREIYVEFEKSSTC